MPMMIITKIVTSDFAIITRVIVTTHRYDKNALLIGFVKVHGFVIIILDRICNTFYIRKISLQDEKSCFHILYRSLIACTFSFLH